MNLAVVFVQLRNVFKYWAGATCPSIPPTLAVDNDLQLLEVETLLGDGTVSHPWPGLRAKTAGTPGPLWNTAPSITALSLSPRLCSEDLRSDI